MYRWDECPQQPTAAIDLYDEMGANEKNFETSRSHSPLIILKHILKSDLILRTSKESKLSSNRRSV